MTEAATALDKANALYREVFDPAHEVSVEGLRQRFEDMLAGFGVPDDVTITSAVAGGVPVLRVSARGARQHQALVWYHSGGYVLGSARGHRGFGAALFRATGREVILVDYRRAPESVFPAAVDDAAAALDAVVADLGPDHVAVGGDSAGGALTLAALCRRRDAGLRRPAHAVLVSPLLDLAATGESMRANAEHDVAVTRDGIRSIVALYLQGQDRAHPEASPIHAVLDNMPPTLVLAGGREALLDDSHRVASALQGAGVAVQLNVYPQMCHAWPLFESFLPEGRAAVEQIGAFVRSARQAGT